MDTVRGFNPKTALEHLISLSDQSIVEVCRALSVTPQQFSDWIKKRRPIPGERLRALCEYFGVPASLLTDNRRFARGLTPLSALELEQRVVAWETQACGEARDRRALALRGQRLEAERQKQLRLARLAALLDANPTLLARVDAFLGDLEAREAARE